MKETLIAYIRDCITFESTAQHTAMKKECLDWFCADLLKASMSKSIRGEYQDSPYLYIPHNNAKLLWFAHFDVVPGEAEQFTLKLEGDKAYGRGVKDMKGAAIPFLLAYKEACERGEDPAVSILLTSDEEIAGNTISSLLQDGKLQAPVAFTPDTGSSPGIVVEHKGVLWAELICSGKGGHCAIPWNTENPIWLLSDALQILKKEFPSGGPDDWQITVTPAKISASDAQNKVPDKVLCSLDIRFPSEVCATSKHAKDLVQKVLPNGCEVREVLSAGALKTDPNNEMVKLLQSIAEEVEGKSIPISREHGATDARYFSEKRIPAFLYGPEGGDLHGSGEWVSIPSLVHQYEIAKKLLQKLAS